MVLRTIPFRLFWLTLVLLALPGCGLTGSADEARPLTGTKWVLVSLNASGEDPVVAHARSNFVIFHEDSSAEGMADCNTCQGSYTAENGSLDVELACTRIGCGRQSLGDEFHLGLLQATAYEIRGDTLTITTEMGQLLFQAE